MFYKTQGGTAILNLSKQTQKTVSGKIKKEFTDALKSKNYDEVEKLLTDHPKLLFVEDENSINFLIHAVLMWDPKLVTLAMKHGATPIYDSEKNVCMNAYITAADMLGLKTQSRLVNFDSEYKIYKDILGSMNDCHSFTQSG